MLRRARYWNDTKWIFLLSSTRFCWCFNRISCRCKIELSWHFESICCEAAINALHFETRSVELSLHLRHFTTRQWCEVIISHNASRLSLIWLMCLVFVTGTHSLNCFLELSDKHWKLIKLKLINMESFRFSFYENLSTLFIIKYFLKMSASVETTKLNSASCTMINILF